MTALRDIGAHYSQRVEVPPPEGGGSGNELPHKSMAKRRHEAGVTQQRVRLLLLTFVAAPSLLTSGGRLLPEIGSANATPTPFPSVNIPDVAGEKMMS